MAQGYWLNYLYVQELKAAYSGRKYQGKVTLSEIPEDERIKELLRDFIELDASGEWYEIIPMEAVNWLNDYVPKLAGIFSASVLERTREVIQKSMLEGSTLQERMKALRESSEELARMTNQRIEAIARTEITRADSMGRLIQMKANDDVIGVEFSAVMDDRTTEMCIERNGLMMRLDDPRLPENTPPLHCNCRSLLISLTIYDYPDGVLTSHEFDEVPAGIQRPEDIETVRALLEEIDTPTEETASQVELIHGVEKTQIDSLRGVRGHKEKYSLTVDDIKQDYERVGIDIMEEYAKEVHSSLYDFTSADYKYMREAFLKDKRGEMLSDEEKKYLARYQLCAEYTKIAPTYEGIGGEIYRGIANPDSEYTQSLFNLKVGDTFDLEMPSSFSTERQIARGFSGSGGVIIHIMDTDLVNAPSISGLSECREESEILVNDLLFEVVKVDDQRIKPGVSLLMQSGDGRYHITLKRKV